jgi:hypothetical protein
VGKSRIIFLLINVIEEEYKDSVLLGSKLTGRKSQLRHVWKEDYVEA